MDVVTEYARDVVEGRIIAGPWVRAACKRHLDDLEHGHERGLVWDLAASQRVIGFFADVLTVEIENKVRPFVLRPWQAFVIGSLFGWMANVAKEDADGEPTGEMVLLRRFRRAFVEIAKGSGKSPMAAGIGHYMLTGLRKERAEVYSAASALDQAEVLFRDAVAMYERSPALRRRLTAHGDKKVKQLSNHRGGFFKPISAEKKGKSGPRPFCVLIDEVHEHPDNTVIEMMRAGTKGNQDALIFEITNSGSDKRSVCGQEHDYSVEVVTGQKPNDAWFAYIAALDTETVDEFDVDAAVQRLDDSCTCSARTTPTGKLELSTGFATAVTSVSDELGISLREKHAPTTLTELFQRAVSATLATSVGSTRLIQSTGPRASLLQLLGARKTAIDKTSQTENIDLESSQKTPPISSTKSAGANTAFLQSLSTLLETINPANARFVAAVRPLSALITVTLQELLEDSSATAAMRDSVCSEIVSKGFARHTPTCAVHQRYKLQSGKLCECHGHEDPFVDENCWGKANPNLGASIHFPYIREQVDEAKGMPSKEGTVRRLNFCQWTEGDAVAIPRNLWIKCQRKVDADVLHEAGYRCFGGLDLSRTRDLSAYTNTWLKEDIKDQWRFVSKTWFWTPKATLAQRAKSDRAPYELWVEQKHLEAVPGPRIKFSWLAPAIAEIVQRYQPEKIGCDQYGLEQLQEALEEIGQSIPAVVHPQGFNRRKIGARDDVVEGEETGAEDIVLWMPDSINKLEAAILEERLEVDDNPVMTMCASGVVYQENRTGHRMFAKDKATSRIDGMVSLAMSIGVATVQPPENAATRFNRAILERAGFA